MKHDIAEEAGAQSEASDGIFSRQSTTISAPDWGGVMTAYMYVFRPYAW